MKRKSRLGRIERVLEVAHAPLAATEHLHHGETSLVRQRVKDVDGVRSNGSGL
jgi:hypothetical protein